MTDDKGREEEEEEEIKRLQIPSCSTDTKRNAALREGLAAKRTPKRMDAQRTVEEEEEVM